MSEPVVRVKQDHWGDGTERRFAFGEAEDEVTSHYLRDGSDPQYFDMVPLSTVQQLASSNEKFRWRYEILVKAIDPYLTADLLEDSGALWVYLSKINFGPLFVGIRHKTLQSSLNIQMYMPVNVADGLPFTRTLRNLTTPTNEVTPVGKFTHLHQWNSIGHGFDIQSSYTAHAMQLARQWLDDCMSVYSIHSYCERTPEEPILPPRVINILSPEKAYLHISSRGERSAYAALSHCWGGVAPLTTTKSCLDTFKECLPAILPQTFADAIRVARDLGFKFLWIDSLCIIQDCIEDWRSHAGHMHDIYSRATLTISSDAAEHADSGFLSESSRKIRRTTEIDCERILQSSSDTNDPTTKTPPTKNGPVLHVRERGNLAYQLPYHDFGPQHPLRSETAARSKLSTRGWAFQERLLSSRTLHFAKSEMAWECRSTCTCECSATNKPRTMRSSSLLKGARALGYTPWIRSLEDDAPNSWRKELVTEFTQLDLTKSSDRLPALAGLAARAAKMRPNDQYLAGLWRDSIAGDLLWYVTDQRPSRAISSTRDEGFVPSWSWAAVTGSVRYPTHQYYRLGMCGEVWPGLGPNLTEAPWFTILSIQYESFQGSSSFALGSKTSPSITISGNLIQIFGLKENDGNRRTVLWPEDCWLHPGTIAHLDIHGWGRSTASSDGVTTPGNLDELSATKVSQDQSEALDIGAQELHVLLADIRWGEVYGLLLARAPHREDAESGLMSFVRIGLISGTKNRPSTGSWDSGGAGIFSPDDEFRNQNEDTEVLPGHDTSTWKTRAKTTFMLW